MSDANKLTSITNPDQALQEFSGNEFISWLADYIAHEVSVWPVLVKLAGAKPEPQKLRKFLAQIFLCQQALWSDRETEPGFLKFAIANLSESDDPSAEPALAVLENRFNLEIAESNKALWVRLFQSLGLTTEELLRLEPKEATRNYIAELSEVYSNFEWQTSLGALVAYWSVVTPEFEAIQQVVSRLENVSDKDFELVKLFAKSQPQSQSLAHELMERLSFDWENKKLIWEGVQRQLAAEQEFLNHTIKYLED